LLKNKELNRAESQFSKRNFVEKRKTKNAKQLLGADINKQFKTEVVPRKIMRSNHRRRKAPSDQTKLLNSNYASREAKTEQNVH
jgi:hypothetical protein